MDEIQDTQVTELCRAIADSSQQLAVLLSAGLVTVKQVGTGDIPPNRQLLFERSSEKGCRRVVKREDEFYDDVIQGDVVWLIEPHDS